MAALAFLRRSMRTVPAARRGMCAVSATTDGEALNASSGLSLGASDDADGTASSFASSRATSKGLLDLQFKDGLNFQVRYGGGAIARSGVPSVRCVIAC